jgi:adenylate kinase family enzyme
MPPKHQKIVVIGSTGSGKTTLAQNIAHRLNSPHIELDALYWGPDWAETLRSDFRTKVSAVLERPAWVVDGNYTKTHDIVWSRADTIVWLDYKLSRIFWQLLIRTFRRVATRERLWNNNREHIREQFFSRNSLMIYLFQTHQRRANLFAKRFAQPEFSQKQLFRFSNPRATKVWLETLKDSE